MKVGFVSLGCPKNHVNCEHMIWQSYEAGYEVALGADDCDIVVVNTCGFLQEAKKEALEEVARLSQMKADGKIEKLIVTGCMTERYREDLEELCPHADGFMGATGYEHIGELIARVSEGKKSYFFHDKDALVPEIDRVVTTSDHWAYLRIGEGCDNRCSFCMIPSIRGRYRSRLLEHILKEAEDLVACGMKEIILVAQDITRYGTDLDGPENLEMLVRELCKIEGLQWLRLHYLYPDGISDELIELIATEDKIVKYIDLPIQHISQPILKAMNRRGSEAQTREIFKKLRTRMPELVIRTSIICGFPGETEEDFEKLCEFLREVKLERAGIFPYSPEEGSLAATMENQVEEEVKRRRLELLTGLQLEVIDDYCERQVGKKVKVLCEGFDMETERFYGRSQWESPEIDGRFYMETEDDFDFEFGEFYEMTVAYVDDGELVGRLEEEA